MVRKIATLSLLALLPGFCFATWQVAGHTTRTPGQQALQIHSAVPYSLNVNPHYTLYVQKGLLFSSVYPYASKHYWKLNWQVPRNIPINVNTKITGPGFTQVMKTLFSFYPNLKVSFNHKSHTVTVHSKHLTAPKSNGK